MDKLNFLIMIPIIFMNYKIKYFSFINSLIEEDFNTYFHLIVKMTFRIYENIFFIYSVRTENKIEKNISENKSLNISISIIQIIHMTKFHL